MNAVADLVVVEAEDSVTILTLNDPGRRNAISPDMRMQLVDRLDAALADDGCRAIVLTGAGGHFCAGGDLTNFGGMSGIEARRRMISVHRVIRALVTGEKPVVAALEGSVSGGGLSLAACCDIAVAAASARFSAAFNRVGLVPDMGASWVLPLRMGLGRARMVMMTGETFDAATAERWGLVERVVGDGETRAVALALARDLATRAPLALGFTKALLAQMPRDLDTMLRAEADAQALLFATSDLEEGRSAFLEKRRPNFSGR